MGKEKNTLSTEDDKEVQKRIKSSSLREDGGYRNPIETGENSTYDATDSSQSVPKYSSFPSRNGARNHLSVTYSPENSELRILDPNVKNVHQRSPRLDERRVSPQPQCNCKASSGAYPSSEEYYERRGCCSRVCDGWRRSSKVRRRSVKVIVIASIFVLLTVLGFILHTKKAYIQRLLGIHVHSVCASEACVRTAGDILSKLDAAVSPCDDFYAFSCGGWKRRFPTPPSKQIWSQFSVAYERTMYKIKELLEKEPRKEEMRPFKLAKKMYKACVNQDRWNEVGVEPLLRTLEDFGGWPLITTNWTGENFDWLKVFSFMRKYYGVTSFISVLIGQDDKDPSRNALYIDQGMLVAETRDIANNDTSTREREIEWMAWVVSKLLTGKQRDDNAQAPTTPGRWVNGTTTTRQYLKVPKISEARDKSELEKDFRWLQNIPFLKSGSPSEGGSRNSEGKKKKRKKRQTSESYQAMRKDIEDVWNFYVEVAKIMHPDPFMQSGEERYNPMTVRGLMKLSPQTNQNINWGQFFGILFSDTRTEITYDTRLVVVQPSFFRRLPDLVERTPKKVLANAILYLLIIEMGSEVSPYFSRFHERKLQRESYSSFIGRYVMRPWYDCSDKLSYYMNLVVTRMYMGNEKEAYLLEANDIKKIAGDFLEELVSVFKLSEWMDDPTLEAAVEKANRLNAIVGFSEKLAEDFMIEAIFLNFPEMNETNHYENIVRAKFYYSHSSLCCLEDEISSRERWVIGILESNAVYSNSQNSIQIPLGILQAPFYRKNAGLPALYGSLGVMIGHEILHGFDGIGSERNWNGTLTPMWTNKTKEKYNRGIECYKDLYSSLTLGEEIRDKQGNLLKVDGDRTVWENFADNEGFSLSWRIYQKLKGNLDQTLIGLEEYSSDQLFFISFAQMWCSNFEQEGLQSLLKNDYHTPEPFRVRGLVRNNPHFAQVFNCSAQAPMTSSEKCAVWWFGDDDT